MVQRCNYVAKLVYSFHSQHAVCANSVQNRRAEDTANLRTRRNALSTGNLDDLIHVCEEAF